MSPEVEALYKTCWFGCPPSKQRACTICETGKKIDELEEKERKDG